MQDTGLLLLMLVSQEARVMVGCGILLLLGEHSYQVLYGLNSVTVTVESGSDQIVAISCFWSCFLVLLMIPLLEHEGATPGAINMA